MTLYRDPQQAAEKLVNFGAMLENHPSAAKAQAHLASFIGPSKLVP